MRGRRLLLGLGDRWWKPGSTWPFTRRGQWASGAGEPACRSTASDWRHSNNPILRRVGFGGRGSRADRRRSRVISLVSGRRDA